MLYLKIISTSNRENIYDKLFYSVLKVFHRIIELLYVYVHIKIALSLGKIAYLNCILVGNIDVFLTLNM